MTAIPFRFLYMHVCQYTGLAEQGLSCIFSHLSEQLKSNMLRHSIVIVMANVKMTISQVSVFEYMHFSSDLHLVSIFTRRYKLYFGAEHWKRSQTFIPGQVSSEMCHCMPVTGKLYWGWLFSWRTIVSHTGIRCFWFYCVMRTVLCFDSPRWVKNRVLFLWFIVNNGVCMVTGSACFGMEYSVRGFKICPF